jgi:hypothetical protein
MAKDNRGFLTFNYRVDLVLFRAFRGKQRLLDMYDVNMS